MLGQISSPLLPVRLGEQARPCHAGPCCSFRTPAQPRGAAELWLVSALRGAAGPSRAVTMRRSRWWGGRRGTSLVCDGSSQGFQNLNELSLQPAPCKPTAPPSCSPHPCGAERCPELAGRQAGLPPPASILPPPAPAPGPEEARVRLMVRTVLSTAAGS